VPFYSLNRFANDTEYIFCCLVFAECMYTSFVVTFIVNYQLRILMFYLFYILMLTRFIDEL